MSRDWVGDLTMQIMEALETPGPAVISVPTQSRKQLAERALERMEPGCKRITFEVTDASHDQR
jgi:hypothetical protein